jgi:hypothetical protein
LSQQSYDAIKRPSFTIEEEEKKEKEEEEGNS